MEYSYTEKGLIGKLVNVLLYLVLYAVVFLGLAWVLLDVPPMEGAQKSWHSITHIGTKITGLWSGAKSVADDAGSVYGFHMQEMRDRNVGRDRLIENADQRLQQQKAAPAPAPAAE